MVDQVQAPYLEAFRVLDKTRTNGRISLQEMESYMRLFGVPDIERFVYITQALDDKLMELRRGNKD